MPITENILDHEVLGREYKKGMQQGMHEGEAKLLRRQVSKRFGNVPQWLDELLSSPTTDLESLSDRVLDAKTLDELKP